MISHGHYSNGRPSPTWVSWNHMKDRCSNKKHPKYNLYGGRGIEVCDRWKISFVDFLTDMGERLPNTSLDRINRDGNYEPGNCRWSDIYTQNKNRFRAKK